MSLLADIEERATRQDTIRQLIAFVVRGTSDPRRVGQRCLLLAHLLTRSEENAASQRELAEQLGVGQSTVCEALAAMEGALAALADPKP